MLLIMVCVLYLFKYLQILTIRPCFIVIININNSLLHIMMSKYNIFIYVLDHTYKYLQFVLS